MIESIHFKNFRVLRDTELRLKPFNVLVGPNGSGKSTVFKALEFGKSLQHRPVDQLLTIGSKEPVGIKITWSDEDKQLQAEDVYLHNRTERIIREKAIVVSNNGAFQQKIMNLFASIQVFAFDVSKIAETVPLQPNIVLSKNGSNLAGALDNLRDISEESFESLKSELRQWLPEFDSILFETPAQGQRSFKLRQAISKGAIRSTDLSEGTLIALALLYIAHNPTSPKLVCLEEPDRGLHPRLLRDLRDALYRLSYPDQFGIKREPVQVIATTHSPYFLDLFRDHPEEIIIAEKQPDATAVFKSLADDKELLELIGDAPLGEIWYTGILGGVPIRK